MRTTLDIDDDLLSAAKELARRDGITAGQMVSRLLRRSLTSPQQPAATTRAAGARARTAGFLPFPARPGVITTNQQVNDLRDSEGI
jgi:hypothetical protein